MLEDVTQSTVELIKGLSNYTAYFEKRNEMDAPSCVHLVLLKQSDAFIATEFRVMQYIDNN